MSNTRSMILLLVTFFLVMVGWQWVMVKIWPPKPPPPHQESVTLAMGGLASGTEPVAKLKRVGKLESEPEKKEKEPEPEPKKQEVVKADKPDFGKLIPLGRGEKPFYLQVLFNSRGGSVQQIIVSEFIEADREGLAIKRNGKPMPLHLVPGVKVPRPESICGPPKGPQIELKPGIYGEDEALLMSEPSFLMFHYEKASDERPLLTLGNKEWVFNEGESTLDDPDEQKVVFQTDLGDPHYVRITKTFTLKRNEYHLGLHVDIKRLDGKKGTNQFRYQLTGANGLPIEGEWYTSVYRQAIVGFSDDRGNTSRYIEDSTRVREWDGTDRQTRTDKLAINYAAVVIQYFASAIAVDDEQKNRKFLEFVRATPVGPTHKGKEFLDDLTVRAITESFDPEPGVSHKYLLYHGPVKVRLLRQMGASGSVSDALVDRYLDKLHLGTLTDAPMPNALGRFANAIFWTDLVIAFTNLIHSLLWAIHQVIPSYGLCILVLTIFVRGMLFPMSRRQSANAQIMQAKMAKLQPELRKLQEKYADDFQKMNQERMKLYKEHHINPFSAMGGCFLLLLQMPVFMGLYYALQESVFLRLDRFLWMPNLAAPDMLIFWSESIPFISTPNDLGSALYLGPFFNVLPVIAVVLMLVQQMKMMPKSDDPQVQAQQRMMKFMMILFGVFFYKVAAGLCIYFIASSIWGLVERKFMPKPKTTETNGDTGGASGPTPAEKEEGPPKPLGWWGRKKEGWREKWKELLENAQKQQEFRREQSPQDDKNDGKKKKKKKR